jgi:endonuclease/exonuclease/phosphatase family metal-dependent hydrolase
LLQLNIRMTGCAFSRHVLAAVAASLIAAACGGSTATGPSSAAAGRRSFTVMTYNIQHGLDANGRYNLQGAVDVIGRLQPDIVGLQEVTRNHPSFNCDDQPSLIADGLQRSSGRSWSVVYEREWFTPDRSCLDKGVGSDVETEGLAFLAQSSLVTVQSVPLIKTRLGLAARTASAVTAPVIVTHLASGSTAGPDRAAQLGQLLPWAAGQGIPRILMGDLNAQPGASELQALTAEYRDAWNDALAAGVARGVMTGDSRVRGGRLDYVLYAGDLQVDSAEIVDTTALLGIRAEVSDHRPVVVRFSTR